MTSIKVLLQKVGPLYSVTIPFPITSNHCIHLYTLFYASRSLSIYRAIEGPPEEVPDRKLLDGHRGTQCAVFFTRCVWRPATDLCIPASSLQVREPNSSNYRSTSKNSAQSCAVLHVRGELGTSTSFLLTYWSRWERSLSTDCPWLQRLGRTSRDKMRGILWCQGQRFSRRLALASPIS